MEKLREILVGTLSVEQPSGRYEFLVDRINKTIRPPREATIDNVNIRVMYIVNDRVNSHGGRFGRADLLKLCGLIIDTPVLIGHNRSQAPLARNFHAELEQKGGALWLKSYFYWPRISDTEKDPFLRQIDSGVLKECSISFTYAYPECSECGQDMRQCPHATGIGKQKSSDSGIHFLYRGIGQVLETSLVFKGSVKGTFLSDKLCYGAGAEAVVISGEKRFPVSLRHDMASDSHIGVVSLDLDYAGRPRVVTSPPGLMVAVAKHREKSYLLVKSA